jgi:hypothetical protein
MKLPLAQVRAQFAHVKRGTLCIAAQIRIFGPYFFFLPFDITVLQLLCNFIWVS